MIEKKVHVGWAVQYREHHVDGSFGVWLNVPWPLVRQGLMVVWRTRLEAIRQVVRIGWSYGLKRKEKTMCCIKIYTEVPDGQS